MSKTTSKPFLTAFDSFERKKLKIKGPSMTDPSYQDECNISLMVEKYKKTGIPPRTVNISYGDSPTADDYINAQILVSNTKSEFEQLPSSVRDRFKSVENYLEFIGDSNNLKECYEKQYINPESVPESFLKTWYPEKYPDTISTITPDNGGVTTQPVNPPTQEAM